MSLFERLEVTEVVKADDIKLLTGIQSTDFNFVDEENPERALKELLETWIERIASHIYVRIGRKVNEDDGDFLAIQDVLVRTVANLVAVAQQQRSSPVVQIDNFAVNILNTSEVTSKLEQELKPFYRFEEGENNKKGWMSVFSSIDKYEEG